MDIIINHISLRAKSSLKTSSDTCAICRENVLDSCNKCQQSNENTQYCQTKKCFSVVGVCSHIYHYCCIQNCINNQSYGPKKCPMCNAGWEMKKRSIQQQPEFKFNKIKKIDNTNTANTANTANNTNYTNYTNNTNIINTINYTNVINTINTINNDQFINEDLIINHDDDDDSDNENDW
jgi:hypothetical protein